MTKKLHLPKFKNESKERDFWSKLDLSKLFDKKDFVSVSLPNLKPSSSAISVRIPNYLLVRLKKAHELHISLPDPYEAIYGQGSTGKLTANLGPIGLLVQRSGPCLSRSSLKTSKSLRIF